MLLTLKKIEAGKSLVLTSQRFLSAEFNRLCKGLWKIVFFCYTFAVELYLKFAIVWRKIIASNDWRLNMKRRIILAFLALMGMASFAQPKSGRVLNIYVWNEEFMTRVRDYYPGYNKSKNTIGDVKVNWVLVPAVDNGYQDALDKALGKMKSAKADDRIDMFLVEPDYALKYLNSQYVKPVKELGITDEDLKHQFKYAKDLGTSADGKLKALCWQVCPGVFAYRRSYAESVLGTDNPVEVQKMVETWSRFDTVAKRMEEAGCYMVAGCEDTFRIFYDNMKQPWVVNGKINIDDSLKAWVKQSKFYAERGYTGSFGMWSAWWMQEMYMDGNVFGYFGPAWFIDFCIPHDDGWYESAYGDWAVCKGPQEFNWGGTMICVAQNTDNAELIKDILLKLTCDEKIMTDIAIDCRDIVNNDKILSVLSQEAYTNGFLGGQNPYQYYLESAASMDKSNVTIYDQGLNECFIQSMMEYFDGTVTEAEAYSNFYKRVKQVYPGLKK